jgi:hypothetical protein
VRQRIVDLYGDVPRIELFARQRASGWHALGNELQASVDGRFDPRELVQAVAALDGPYREPVRRRLSLFRQHFYCDHHGDE